MTRVAKVGAGSLVFYPTAGRDLLLLEPPPDAEVRLVDVDPQRLEGSRVAVKRVVVRGAGKTSVLAGTDLIINSIQISGEKAAGNRGTVGQ